MGNQGIAWGSAASQNANKELFLGSYPITPKHLIFYMSRKNIKTLELKLFNRG